MRNKIFTRDSMPTMVPQQHISFIRKHFLGFFPNFNGNRNKQIFKFNLLSDMRDKQFISWKLVLKCLQKTYFAMAPMIYGKFALDAIFYCASKLCSGLDR